MSGIITTIAGDGQWSYGGDGGPAVNAQLSVPIAMVADPLGNLYFADSYNYRIRKVDTNGIITTVAGNGEYGLGGDGRPAVNAQLNGCGGLARDASGNLYLTQLGGVRMVAAPSVSSPAMAAGDIFLAEENGLGHIMNSAGYHKSTIDLDTGQVLLTFGYNQTNHLISMTDRFGNQTTIERNARGVPTSIISPDGIVTELTVDAGNHLTRIAYPDSSAYQFEYTNDGLLTAKIDPKQNRFEHVFDAMGRLEASLDPEGGHWRFSRDTDAAGNIVSTTLSAEGDRTIYLDRTESTGAFTAHVTDASGGESVYSESADGLSVTKALSCGMNLAFQYDLDSRNRFKTLKQMTRKAPSGLQKLTLRSRTYQDTDADQVPDRITDQVTVNGKAGTFVTDTRQATKTSTSPLGRAVTESYDPATLLTASIAIPGLHETTYGYDPKGRLTTIRTNTRETALTYDGQGNNETVTDPEEHTTTYRYDEVGRVTSVERPDQRVLGLRYDKNGNLMVFTNPVSIPHGFDHNRVNFNSSYTTPLSGTYRYLYDLDRRLTDIHFPSGKLIHNVYEQGRLTQTQTPEGKIDLSYLCGAKLGSVAREEEKITYGYDGSLVTSETFAGTLNLPLGYAYNNDFRPSRFTYAGGSVDYTYDNDGLLTRAGSFTIGRNAQNGLPEAVTGGALNLTRSFTGYGEQAGQSFTVNGANSYSFDLTRDNNGKILTKTETVDGVATELNYHYDPAGRLLTVTQNGTLVEEHGYNGSGARDSERNTLRGISSRSFQYSDEDHLLTAGDTSYEYNADGFLTTKTRGAENTHYTYSSRGELLAVALPNGTLIEYVTDPLGRRIAKKINGTITEKYLWQGQTRLLAVYDGSNQILMRFQYADARMPVAMTKGTTTYYLAYDQVGSLRLISDPCQTPRLAAAIRCRCARL